MLRSTLSGLTAAALCLITPFAAAQGVDAAKPSVRPAPPALMTQFDVSAATVQSLTVPAGNPATANIDVMFAGVPHRLMLGLHDVRAQNFQLWEDGPAGLQQLARPACVTYRGLVAADPGSDVAAKIEGGSITVYARMSNGDLWVAQPVREVRPNVGPALHIVFRGRDSVNVPGQCGLQTGNLPVPAVAVEDAVYLAQLAVNADYPYYQQNGSNTTTTQNDITGIVNAMNVIYERDVDIRLTLGQVIVYTSPVYTTSQAGTLLNQFASRWNSVHGGVSRDLAHLFTGRNISGGTIGIATLGTVCSVGSAYGLSQSRYTGNYTLRVSLTAHEIGHNFGAGHCNSSPPCHIMCSGNGGCSSPTLFGTSARNQIIAYRQSVGCLTLQYSSPSLSVVSPATVETVSPAQVTVTGTDLIGTTHATINGSTVNVTVLSDTQLRFYPPAALPLGLHTFNVTNPAGTSNNRSLWYTTANPAQLIVPAVILGGNTVTWTMGGVNGDFAFLVISLTNTTSPWLGWNLVNSPVVLWQGGLDGLGMATYSFPVPSMVFNGLQVYTQMIDIVGGSLNIRSLSTVKPTLVVL